MNRNQLPSASVARDYIMTNEDIFGSNLISIKINTTRRTIPVALVTRVLIPPEINYIYMYITL